MRPSAIGSRAASTLFAIKQIADGSAPCLIDFMLSLEFVGAETLLGDGVR